MDNYSLTDDALLRRVEALAGDERAAMYDLVMALAELDRRRLYESEKYVSLFDYCVHRLRLSEAAAYRRIRAARAVNLFPPVGPLLRDGKLSLEAIALLHPFLEKEEAPRLVTEASGMRVRQVEKLVAPLREEAPRREVIRLSRAPSPPAPVPSEPPSLLPAAPPPPAAVLAAQTAVRIAFTADEDFLKLLREAQSAMRHKYPDGRIDGVFRDALRALLKKKRPFAFPRRA